MEQQQQLDRMRRMLEANELPTVFDLEGEDLEHCARVFSLDNGIPFERLNLSVFETLARLQSVADLIRCPLFYKTAKTAAIASLRNAFETKSIRVFSTQGILDKFVHPTQSEAESPLARLDTGKEILPSTTMGEHPFFSECVSGKFLQFWISPSGELRFLCDLLDDMPMKVKKEYAVLKSRLADMMSRKEDSARERESRKIEKKMARQLHAEQQCSTYKADKPSRLVGDGISLGCVGSDEEKERLRRRKERAEAERHQRTIASSSPVVGVANRTPSSPRARKIQPRKHVAAEVGRKAESIEKASNHTHMLRRKELDRVAEAEALLEIRRIGDAIQHGD